MRKLWWEAERQTETHRCICVQYTRAGNNNNPESFNCHKPLKLTLESRKDHTTMVVFRCYNKHCKKNCYSIRQGSVFELSKLSLQQIIVIINLFCGHISSYEQIIFQAQLGKDKLSRETVGDWLTYCHEICLEIVERQMPTLLGGQDSQLK